jgi:hypothetical protein
LYELLLYVEQRVSELDLPKKIIPVSSGLIGLLSEIFLTLRRNPPASGKQTLGGLHPPRARCGIIKPAIYFLFLATVLPVGVDKSLEKKLSHSKRA